MIETNTQSQTDPTHKKSKKRFQFLNPNSRTLLFRQLMTMWRRPQSFWMLGIALFVICFGFAVAYNKYTQHKLSENELTLAGRLLLSSYRSFSLFLIAVIAPIIGVQAISQERESGTLDLMLTSAVPPLGFALSKIIAASVAMLTAIIGTLPLLALILPMGGVGPNEVIALGISQIFVAIVSLCFGIVMGARMPSFITGMVSAYSLTAVFVLITFFFLTIQSRLTFPFKSGSVLEFVVRFLLFCFSLMPWMVVVSILVIFMIAQIPKYLSREINRVKPRSWRPIRLKGVDTQLWTFLGVRDYGDSIHPHQNPVYVAERERFLSFVARREFDAPSVLWLVSILFTFVALRPDIMLDYGMLVVFIFVPLVGATMISGEHERGSWDPLRSSLLKPGKILRGKLGLTVGQGWIHVVAFYTPPLLIVGFVWLLIAYGHHTGYSKFQPWNVYPVWMGHLLVAIVIALTVCLAGALSVWISTFHHRTFSALLFSYTGVALFLWGPQFLKMIHPTPGTALGGEHEMDIVSTVLATLNANFIFNLWPTSVSKQSELHSVVPPLFWNLYLIHVLLLILLIALFAILARLRINQSDR